MLAFLDCSRCGTARRVQLNWPVRSMARQRSQSSGLISSTRPVGPAMPALLTRQSRPPSDFQRLIEEPRDLGAVGDVADGLRELRVALPGGGQRRLVDVADVHARALAHEGAGDLEPDARRPRRHQHAQALDAEVHVLLPLPILHGERVGARGRRLLRRLLLPLTLTLSPQAGRGDSLARRDEQMPRSLPSCAAAC